MAEKLTDEQDYLLMCAIENLRSADRNDRTVEAAWRMAEKMEAWRKASAAAHDEAAGEREARAKICDEAARLHRLSEATARANGEGLKADQMAIVAHNEEFLAAAIRSRVEETRR